METHSSFVTVDDEKTLNTVADSSSSCYSMIPFNTFGVALAVKHPSFSISCQNADRHGRLYTSFLVHRITFLPRWLDRKTKSHWYFKCILEIVTTKRGLLCLWCAKLLDLAGKTFFFLLLSIRLYALNWIVFHFQEKKGPKYMDIWLCGSPFSLWLESSFQQNIKYFPAWPCSFFTHYIHLIPGSFAATQR